MTNKEIISSLKLAQKLLELHDANPFKVKGYGSALFNLEKISSPIADLTPDEFEANGIKKGMREKISTFIQTGTFDDLEELLSSTPTGILEMLNIKGVGPKKIKVLWKEVGIENKTALLEACREGKIESVKGFGKKTQESIIEALEFEIANAGNHRFANTQNLANHLLQVLESSFPSEKIHFAGQFRRAETVINKIEILLSFDKVPNIDSVNTIDFITQDPKASGPLTWRGYFNDLNLAIEIQFCTRVSFNQKLLQYSGAQKHLSLRLSTGQTIYQALHTAKVDSEAEFYQDHGFHCIPAEAREGFIESMFKSDQDEPTLLTNEDLKGILHNHSTYSDGKNTLEEMANYCKELGYEYLGMSDHSVSAFYANGLNEQRIIQQQEEIDALNQRFKGFKVFKGIESDILNDGSLDYPNEVLKTFDFIVASIHSNLGMDEAKATNRLIKAVENPYTTILGHPTGRLLVAREGYPINHKKIIDACAANGVIIEINASPWRLDIDWTWVPYCMEKGVLLSINPDAHELKGYHDMQYGVLAGRKGGLTPDMTFNTKPLAEVEGYFQKKKPS